MKILIADDNVTNRKMLLHQLADAGYEVRAAMDGGEALALLEGEPFDGLISDILMPRMDGYELCMEIRRNRKLLHLPVILYTGTFVSAEDEKLALDVGADRFIRKPAQTEVLVNALAESAAERRALRRTPRGKKKLDEVMREHSERLIQKITDKNLELERANEESREREQRLNSIIFNEPECIKLLAHDGSLVEMNPAGLAMLEADSLKELQGKPIYSLIKQEHRAAFRELTESVFKGGSGKLEFEIVGLKGTPRWLETQAVPMRDEQGQVTALLGLTRDITEHKQVGNQRAELLNILESSQNEIYIFSAETLRFQYANNGALRNLGYSRTDIEMMTPLDLKPEFDEVSFRNLLVPLLSHEMGQLVFETVHRRADASLYAVEVHLQLTEQSGKPVFLAMILDITERRQREAELKKLSGAMEQTADQVIITDGAGVIEYVNQAFEQATGYTKEEVFGQTPRMLKSGEHDARFYEGVWKTILAGKVFRGIFINRRKNGELFHEEKTITPLRDEQENITHFISTGRDISEKKRAEQRIRANEERYRHLVENASDETSILAADGSLLYESPSANPTLGYAPGEFIQRNLFELIHPEDVERIRNQFARLVQDPSLHPREEFRLRHRDGSWRWVEAVGTNLLAEPSVGGIVINYHDIGERKQAEENLAASESELRAIFSAMQDVVFLIDRHGIYRKVAPTNPELFYKPAEEVLGKSFSEIFPAREAEQFQTAVDEVLASGKLKQIDYSLEIGGALRWFSATITSLSAEMTVWVVHEITERKRAEEKLAASETELRVLFEAERKQRALAESLRDTAEILNRTLNLGEVLDAILANVGRVVPHDTASVRLIDMDRVRLVRSRGFAELGIDIEKVGNQLQLSGVNNLQKMLATRRPVLVADTHSDPAWVSMPGTEILHSNIGAPIVIENEVAGFLFLDSLSPGFYTSEHAEHLLAFANQAALAIQQARLYRQAQQEIAERGQVEEALRASETRFRALIENSADLIIVVDSEGMMRFVSPSAERVLGYSPEEALGRNFLEWIHPDDLSIAVEALNNRIKIPGSAEAFIELRGLHKNGTWRMVEALGTNLLADPYVKGIVLNIRDISERKQAEEALRYSSNLLNLTGQMAQTGGWELNLETQTLYWTDEVYRIHEVDPATHPNVAEAINFYAPEAQPVISAAVQAGIDSGTPWDLELQLVTAKDRRIWVRAQGSAERRDNKTVRLYGAFQDITKRKQAERELQQHLTELELLYQSGLAINQLTNRKVIAERIIELLDSKMDWHHTAIRYYDAQQGRFELLAFHQPGLQTEQEKRQVAERFDQTVTRLGQGLSGWAVEHRQIVRSSDLAHDSRYVDTFPGLQSGLYVPLMVGERAIGVISIESENADAFSEADERLTVTLAAQAASALENARLFGETLRRAEEFESLYKTTRDLSIAQDLPSILKTVTQRAAALLGVANASLNLLDAAKAELVVAASTGLDLPIGSRRPFGDGISGRVAQTGAPIIVQDYQQWEHRSRFFEGIPLAAIMGVPLIYESTVLGVLDVSDLAPSKRTFGEADMRLLGLFAAQAASAIANRRLYEETVHRLEKLNALHTIDEAIAGSMDINFALKVILDRAISQLAVDAAAILLFDAQEQTLKYVSGQGFRTEALQFTRLALGDGYAGKAAVGHELIYIPDLRTRNTDFLRSPKFSQEGFVSYFAVPLIAKGEVQGVLEILHRSLLEPTSEWLQFLDNLSKQSAIAINNATLYKNLQTSNIELTLAYDATIEGWSHALDLRDKETEGHTLRVTQMTMELASHMNIDTKELLHIRRGALLHDIGKMGVPDQILLKAGALTEEEWALMRQHPQHAFNMLKPIQFLAPALDIPYCHHEKWDGTGYPRGLKETHIPLAARIFAVVDVWDALTSDRPYRPAWTKDKALAHIQSISGSHFDPAIVPVFMDLLAAQA